MVAQSGLDLMDRTSDPEKIEKLKAGIRHAIDRGAKLTQQLLTFARKSPLHPEVVDIGMRLRSMDTLLERSLGENFSVDYRIAPQLRSEEHTSELQSLMRISYAVFCLKKKTK